MQIFDFSANIEIQPILIPGFEGESPKIFMKRLDLIHPVYGGNKAFKLKYHIQKAVKNKCKAILSYGGPFSNHLYALSGLSKEIGIKSIGIVRGFEHYRKNPTLKFCTDAGMNLHFLSPKIFEDREERQNIICQYEKSFNGAIHEVPEGGSDERGVLGAKEMLGKEFEKFDFHCIGIGTGGSISGLIRASEGKSQILGFSALKGALKLDHRVAEFTRNCPKNWQVFHDYHFGGFAKQSTITKDFKKHFESLNSIEIDPVYQVKMLLGLQDLIKKRYFSTKKKILVYHTGGLQASAGYDYLAQNGKLKN